MEFRFFRLNRGGVVDSAETVKLADEVAALNYVPAFAHGSTVEVWLRDRKIATVPAARR